MAQPERPKWVKDKSTADGFEVVQTPAWDDYKDFKIEPTGHYVLVKILWDKAQISVAVCDKEHRILREFRGRRAQDIWTALFSYEEQHNVQWLTRKDHIAYLGKELKKAEIALAMGNTGYYQE
ncbi:MAG TPA: DUF4346 domain-containing protein [Candidatus Nanoarchaeia archaeon]|nr:DUF4346 domain-containing protein [Candidatus Nanoarchaeia archaeon]